MVQPRNRMGTLALLPPLLCVACGAPVTHWTTTPQLGLSTRSFQEGGAIWIQLEVPRGSDREAWSLEGDGEPLEIQSSEGPHSVSFRWRLDPARVAFFGTRGYALRLREGAREFKVNLTLQPVSSAVLQVLLTPVS